MGYPPIPFSAEPVLVAGLGEINATIDKYVGKHPQFIISTMARRRALQSPTGMLAQFAKFCQPDYDFTMSTMNISLPGSLKDFVDEQVEQRGYGTSSEYLRELIRKDQDRLRLRGLLLAGASSAQIKPVDTAYFAGLRRKAKAGVRR